ncbi:MAG: hypothetical protein AAFY56_15895 [Pseudomonadota bacterium]
MLLRKLMLVAAAVGMIAGQGVVQAQAGPLLDRSAAGQAMQTAALEPMHLTDETMDDVSAGIIGAAILLGLTLVTIGIGAEGIHHDNQNSANHGCRGQNCNNAG